MQTCPCKSRISVLCWPTFTVSPYLIDSSQHFYCMRWFFFLNPGAYIAHHASGRRFTPDPPHFHGIICFPSFQMLWHGWSKAQGANYFAIVDTWTCKYAPLWNCPFWYRKHGHKTQRQRNVLNPPLTPTEIVRQYDAFLCSVLDNNHKFWVQGRHVWK